MKKIKVNENILALVLFVSFFASPYAYVVALLFIWGFCEMKDALKDLSIKIGVVLVAISVLKLGWDVVLAAKDLLFGGLDHIFQMLVSWGVDSSLTLNTTQYLFNPLEHIFAIASAFVMFVILYVQLRFVLSVIKNEEMRGALWPLQSLINKATNFVNNNFYEDNKSAKKASGAGSFCNKCGTKSDGNTAFCSSCGNKL